MLRRGVPLSRKVRGRVLFVRKGPVGVWPQLCVVLWANVFERLVRERILGPWRRFCERWAVKVEVLRRVWVSVKRVSL